MAREQLTFGDTEGHVKLFWEAVETLWNLSSQTVQIAGGKGQLNYDLKDVEFKITQGVRTLLGCLPFGRAKRLIVAMADDYGISHNEPRVEYGSLNCVTCYGAPPMILEPLDKAEDWGHDPYNIQFRPIPEWARGQKK